MTRLLTDILWAILLLSGAGSAEELSESEMERFEHYSRHPLPVNQVSRSRMLSSGLFSAYQVAAIEEYRSHSGDILGPTELSLVDGIGKDNAEALSCFLSFESALPPGAREDNRLRQSLMLRVSARDKTGNAPEKALAAGGKYHLQLGERAEFYWSVRNTYSNPDPGAGTLSLELSSRRGTRLVLGDFAARFGQGLALWSSFSMSGFGSVAAFRRSAGGFAPTGSFSPSLRGAAVDLPLGRWSLGAAGSLSDGDVMPMLTVRYFGHRGQFGLQALHGDGSVASLDGTLGMSHWTIFGEAALSSRLLEEDSFIIRRTRVAAVGGARWAPAYRTQFAALARYYPSGFYSPSAGAPRSASKTEDEAGLSLGGQWRWVELILDGARHPEKKTEHFKGILSLSPVFRLGGVTLSPSLRWTERLRPQETLPWRHEMRLDLKASRGIWNAACRVDLVRCKEFGALAYTEIGIAEEAFSGSSSASAAEAALPEGQPLSKSIAGRRAETDRLKLNAYLRVTTFNVENWADRIYCYERDLPGAFSVPAYYGRGWVLSMVAGIKNRRNSLNLRASLRRQVPDSRTDTAEIKLQYRIDW